MAQAASKYTTDRVYQNRPTTLTSESQNMLQYIVIFDIVNVSIKTLPVIVFARTRTMAL